MLNTGWLTTTFALLLAVAPTLPAQDEVIQESVPMETLEAEAAAEKEAAAGGTRVTRPIPAAAASELESLRRRVERLENENSVLAQKVILQEQEIQAHSKELKVLDKGIKSNSKGIIANSTAIARHDSDIRKLDSELDAIARRTDSSETILREISRFDFGSNSHVLSISDMQKRSDSFQRELRHSTRGRLEFHNPHFSDRIVYVNGVAWSVRPGNSYVPVPTSSPVDVQVAWNGEHHSLYEWRFVDDKGYVISFSLR